MVLACWVLAVLPVLGAAVGAGSGGAGVEVAVGWVLAAWAAVCFFCWAAVGFFWAVVDDPDSDTLEWMLRRLFTIESTTHSTHTSDLTTLDFLIPDSRLTLARMS